MSRQALLPHLNSKFKAPFFSDDLHNWEIDFCIIGIEEGHRWAAGQEEAQPTGQYPAVD